MFVWYKLDPDDNISINLENLSKKAMRLLRAKKKLANFVYIEKKSQKVEYLIIKYNQKSYIGSNLDFFVTPPSIPTYYPPGFLSTLFIQMSGTDYWPID